MIAAGREVWASAFHPNDPINRIAADAAAATSSLCIGLLHSLLSREIFAPRRREGKGEGSDKSSDGTAKNQTCDRVATRFAASAHSRLCALLGRTDGRRAMLLVGEKQDAPENALDWASVGANRRVRIPIEVLSIAA